VRLRTKLLISVVLQILLFALVPPLLTRAGLRAANWVRVWEHISDHEFFSSKARDRVVLLGDSTLGTRYCHVSPQVPNAPLDDDCTLRSIMSFERSHYPGLERFEFFDFTSNGTLAEAHLYYFLLMLSQGGDSIRYLIYSLPGKLTLDLHDRSYFVLNEQAANLIDALPPALRSEKLSWLSHHYRERLDAFAKEQTLFHERDRFRRFREIFWAHRSFVQDLLGDLRERYAPDSSEAIFGTYYKKFVDGGGLTPVDHFQAAPATVNPNEFFTKESDFLFLDILSELCHRLGIQLILFAPPDRVTCPAPGLEPCDSNIYQPIFARYRGRPGIQILDNRRDPYLVPRDSLDGTHPSLLKKLALAKEFLHEISESENKRPR